MHRLVSIFHLKISARRVLHLLTPHLGVYWDSAHTSPLGRYNPSAR
jgi:hypothetical protein